MTEKQYVQEKKKVEKENINEIPKQNIDKKEEKVEDKKIEKKEVKKEIVKKEQAIINARSVGISKKTSMDICRYIKGRKIDEAIKELEDITKMKKALPMRGEIPHRHGMMSGRYPITCCKEFIRILKSLRANAGVNGINNPYIVLGSANDASRPYRRFGSRKFKRTHITLIAKDLSLNTEKNKEK